MTRLDADVQAGPLLLAAIGAGPGLVAHRRVRGELPAADLNQLLEVADGIDLRGRGGAGFPFAAKLRAVRQRSRTPVVVNVCEGEPVSAKDSALALLAPHLVLDGAVLVARALRSRRVHIVTPAERPTVSAALQAADAERDRHEDGLRFDFHVARPGFVSGQSRAVVELIEGRDNVPVTASQPVAVAGLGGRPTLLSNAETYAQLAAAVLRRPPGKAADVLTTLLTIDDGVGRRRVLEVPVHAPWSDVLTPEALRGPVLVGGYHGRWAPAGSLTGLTVSRHSLSGHGLTLGAGVVIVPHGCPLVLTADIAGYLAGQSARRCGPCYLGLPTLAELCRGLLDGTAGAGDAARVATMVTGRGACAHPDGTAAMVGSALRVLEDEIGRHRNGECLHDDGPLPRAG